MSTSETGGAETTTTQPAASYQRVTDGDENVVNGNHDSTAIDGIGATDADRAAARRTLWNFTLMSALFSANHGCVVGKQYVKNSKQKPRTSTLLFHSGYVSLRRCYSSLYMLK